jgi:hypothetical protein
VMLLDPLRSRDVDSDGSVAEYHWSILQSPTDTYVELTEDWNRGAGHFVVQTTKLSPLGNLTAPTQLRMGLRDANTAAKTRDDFIFGKYHIRLIVVDNDGAVSEPYDFWYNAQPFQPETLNVSAIVAGVLVPIIVLILLFVMWRLKHKANQVTDAKPLGAVALVGPVTTAAAVAPAVEVAGPSVVYHAPVQEQSAPSSTTQNTLVQPASVREQSFQQSMPLAVGAPVQGLAGSSSRTKLPPLQTPPGGLAEDTGDAL